ncbi:MAG: LON peptidase substrate-binding domain-containing protein, partial [Anaerolineales bacterium]
MAPSKWLDDLTEMWDWMEAEESQALQELLFHPTVTKVVQGKGELSKSGKTKQVDRPELPDELPILPLRGVVVYPQTGVPLTIGQPRSIRLVDDAVSGSRL